MADKTAIKRCKLDSCRHYNKRFLKREYGGLKWQTKIGTCKSKSEELQNKREKLKGTPGKGIPTAYG